MIGIMRDAFRHGHYHALLSADATSATLIDAFDELLAPMPFL